MMTVKEAIEALTSTYASLDAVAQGLSVDAGEVAEALKSANPDSAEFVALTVLAKYNPVKTVKKTAKNADTDNE